MQEFTVINQSRATVIGKKIAVADTFWTRLRGLLGRRGLDEGAGLLISPSQAVHTFAMRFAIDVVYLDAGMRVRGMWQGLRPWRMTPIEWKTRSVLELPVGGIARAGIQMGDRLEMVANKG
jgi:hypothetical protein